MTNTYTLAFSLPKIRKEVKTWYSLERNEQYNPEALKFFKFHMLINDRGFAEDVSYVKDVAKKKPDHREEDNPNETKCPNWQ